MAREIAGNAPLAIRGTKRILGMCVDFSGLPPGEADEAEDLIHRCMESRDDFVEGIRAFLEKGKPASKGR